MYRSEEVVMAQIPPQNILGPSGLSLKGSGVFNNALVVWERIKVRFLSMAGIG